MMRRLGLTAMLGVLFAGGYIAANPRKALCNVGISTCDYENLRTISVCDADPGYADFQARGQLVDECGANGCCGHSCYVSVDYFGEQACAYCTGYPHYENIWITEND